MMPAQSVEDCATPSCARPGDWVSVYEARVVPNPHARQRCETCCEAIAEYAVAASGGGAVTVVDGR